LSWWNAPVSGKKATGIGSASDPAAGKGSTDVTAGAAAGEAACCGDEAEIGMTPIDGAFDGEDALWDGRLEP
jgi:hypothetical protein